MMKPLVLSQNEDQPTHEALAQAIVNLSEGMKTLNASRLKRETIIILLQAASKVKRTDIIAVLDALGDLEKRYLKPEPPK